MFGFDGCCYFCFWFGLQWSLSRHCECQNTAVSCEMSLMTLPSDLHPPTAGKLRVLQVPSSPRRNWSSSENVGPFWFGQRCPTVCGTTLAVPHGFRKGSSFCSQSLLRSAEPSDNWTSRIPHVSILSLTSLALDPRENLQGQEEEIIWKQSRGQLGQWFSLGTLSEGPLL